ncbi:MAG: YbaN family protein [Candidatus Methanoplasma sp.]|jgi:uncharacterized membrane protein YbaN (DUF454 family)|nr:YbaN family protein [Candidatus Methanoplasma sp.]
MNKIKRAALITAGCAFVLLGAIGAFLPILPTTPFIIVAAICFSTSSPRMYSWLAGNRYFGEYIDNYRTGAGVSKRTKANALVFLWAMLLISGFFMRNNHMVLLILLIVGICVTAHVLLLRKRQPTVQDTD